MMGFFILCLPRTPAYNRGEPNVHSATGRLPIFCVGYSGMADPISVRCEVCGKTAEIAANSHVDAEGKRLEWPKAVVKHDGLYFTIRCPHCGEREQCMVRKADTD